MSKEKELAKAVVESYGKPDFPAVILEFNTAIGNERVRLHLLNQAGLKKAMLNHAKTLRSDGKVEDANLVKREVNLKFGNVSGKAKKGKNRNERKVSKFETREIPLSRFRPS